MTKFWVVWKTRTKAEFRIFIWNWTLAFHILLKTEGQTIETITQSWPNMKLNASTKCFFFRVASRRARNIPSVAYAIYCAHVLCICTDAVSTAFKRCALLTFLLTYSLHKYNPGIVSWYIAYVICTVSCTHIGYILLKSTCWTVNYMLRIDHFLNFWPKKEILLYGYKLLQWGAPL